MKKIFSVILIVLLSAFFLRGFIVKGAISGGVKLATGLDLEIGRLDIGVFRTAVVIKNMKLLNPSGFSEPVMMDVPEISFDYDLGAILSGKIHIENMKLRLKELNVIKNAKNTLNLDTMKDSLQSRKEQPVGGRTAQPQKQAKVSNLMIDKLDLEVGKVTYRDYSPSAVLKTANFNLNIHEKYENIQDAQAFVNLLMLKALGNTTITSLTNFDGAIGTTGTLDRILGGSK